MKDSLEVVGGSLDKSSGLLLTELQAMIVAARREVAKTVNASLVTLHWNIGNRIRQDILQEKRAGYGEQVVDSLAKSLKHEFGSGFGKRNIFRMIRFSEVFPDFKIVSSLMAQLSWTHLLHIIAMSSPA